MSGLDLFDHSLWRPGFSIGLTHQFFDLHKDTLIYTWIAMALLFACGLLGKIAVSWLPQGMSAFLTKKYVKTFLSLTTQSVEKTSPLYTQFICTLFTYILICNLLVIIPGLEEPTKDLNTTIALALCAFFFIQKEALKAHGIWGYLQEYIKMPFPFFSPRDAQRSFVPKIILITLRSIGNIIIGIGSFPLEALGKFASIISLSFRLFGNIFGGAMIHHLWHQAMHHSIFLSIASLFGIQLAITLFFGIFEGVVQAFVFSILSLTYLAMAVRHEETHP